MPSAAKGRRDDRNAWQIKVSHKLTPILVGDGFALPENLTVTGTKEDLEVVIDIEVDGDRASAARVSVATAGEWGVSSTTLRNVPVRDLTATAIAMSMLQVEVISATNIQMTPADEGDPDVIATVARLVGYKAEPVSYVEVKR